jgi:phosphoribosyl 1,2-cyclic phosphate phosphodiesterase
LAKQPHTTDIRGQFILLGTGTSVGVPALGCGCPVCLSDHPRNKRTRCAAIVGLPEGNLLIDTPVDLRQQLLRERIGIAHAVAYTHEHADHVMGMDDLRLFQFYVGGHVPLFCRESVEVLLRSAFAYAFNNVEQTHIGAVPNLEFRRIDDRPFETLGARVQPIPLKHGPRFDVLGFRIGNVAYCTDTNEVPPSSMALLQDLDVLILDGLRHRPHVTHFNIEQAVAVAQQINARQTYFTHCACELDYETTNKNLPARMELAYDGLRIQMT